jgi:hypothetical protein
MLTRLTTTLTWRRRKNAYSNKQKCILTVAICFTNNKILSICLIGIMQDIGAPLKTYRRIVALFKDVITERIAITTTFRHWHTAINHFSQQFCMKGLYPTVMTQPSPRNDRFYPVPVHNAQAMIESVLY